MNRNHTLFWIILFGVSFGFVESSVVVYLRALYYPDGFSFPLKVMESSHILVELAREIMTIVMLAAAGVLAGKTRWQKFSYFMIAFAVWDIFYYLWLKVILGWPVTLFDWDILFLIPIPWISPVIAPVAISIIMIVTGILIIRQEEKEGTFTPSIIQWILAILGTAILLLSFMIDLGASLRVQQPQPYRYDLFVLGLCCYIGGLWLAFFRRRGSNKS
ncbi:MAG: hypothetical protein V1799_05480 [bacterium]